MLDHESYGWGRIILGPLVYHILPTYFREAVLVSTYPLSSREVEILDHIARGSSNKEIAKSLQISDQMVKNHITSILKKLSVDDRTAAVVYAIRRGWIALELSSATGDSEAARTKTSSVAEGLAI